MEVGGFGEREVALYRCSWAQKGFGDDLMDQECHGAATCPARKSIERLQKQAVTLKEFRPALDLIVCLRCWPLAHLRPRQTFQYQYFGADTSNLPQGEDCIRQVAQFGALLDSQASPSLELKLWPGCRSFAPGNGDAGSTQMLAVASEGRIIWSGTLREKAPRLKAAPMSMYKGEHVNC